MISVFNPYHTTVQGVWEIGEGFFRRAEKRTTQFTIGPTGEKTPKKVQPYVAESTSAILVETEYGIEITVGRLVSENVLKNILSYALTNKKPLSIKQCETLENLQAVDRMVLLCNEFLTKMEPDVPPV
jgi:hypothetical protein